MKLNNRKLKGKGVLILIVTSLFLFSGILLDMTSIVNASSGTFEEDFTTTTYMDSFETNSSGWGTGAVESSKQKPTLVSSISSTFIGNTLDVFVDGNIAYVTNEAEGLKAVNITDSANPYIIGTYTTADVAQGIVVNGDYAYVADYEGDDWEHKNFLILNITDPTNPSSIGNCTTYNFARDIALHGNIAYVPNMDDGLRIINITDVFNPVSLGVLDTPGSLTDICIHGDYAYAVDGSNGLLTLNIANPISPSIIDTYSNLSTTIDVIAEGDYVYVIDTNGFQILSISNPSKPTFVSEYLNAGFSCMTISDDFLYLVDIDDGLFVINVDDATQPQLVTIENLPGIAQNIFLSGTYIYIASYSGGLQILKIADATSPNQLCYVSIPTPSRSFDKIAISGRYAYAPIFQGNLRVYDIENPNWFSSQPTVVITNPRDLAISGDILYVCYNSGLAVYNISNPSSPVYLGTKSLANTGSSIEIVGDIAYVTSWHGGFYVLDISDPLNIKTIAFSTLGDPFPEMYDIKVAGGYAFIADGQYGLKIVDIKDPKNLVVYSPGYIGISRLTLHGNYIYFTSDYFRVLDITNPTNPVLVYSNSSYILRGMAIQDDYLYSCHSTDGILKFNILNPTKPDLVESTAFSAGSPYNIIIHGDYAFTSADSRIFRHEISINKAKQYESLCLAQSSEIFTSTSEKVTHATVSVIENTPVDTEIAYSLSADGGSNWESITPGIEHVFSNQGGHLKWKAVLTTLDYSISPEIFNISIDYTTKLNDPSLDTPSDSAITDDYMPTFSWSGINGESEFLFQLDTTTSFTTPLLNITLPSSTTSYTPSSPLAEDTYYWRVAGIDTEGDLGEFSNYRTLYLITDANPPIISNPSDVSYEQGATGNSITWSPSDSNPYWYNITINGFLTSHDNLWTGGEIVLDIDGLSLGTYTAICYVYDLEGLMNSDSVEIEVTLSAPPSIDDVADFEYEEGSTGNSITWHPSDVNPDYYSITRDGEFFDDGPWLGGAINIDVDGLAYGTYTFICFVNDTEGQSATDSVVVTVTDSIDPILNSPLDVIYTEGDTGNNIIWIASDTNPATYIVYKNGVVEESDSWTSGSSIIICVDGLSTNQYNYTIVVEDQAGNLAKDTVIVAVTGAVPELPLNSVLFVISIVAYVVIVYRRRGKM